MLEIFLHIITSFWASVTVGLGVIFIIREQNINKYDYTQHFVTLLHIIIFVSLTVFYFVISLVNEQFGTLYTDMVVYSTFAGLLVYYATLWYARQKALQKSLDEMKKHSKEELPTEIC